MNFWPVVEPCYQFAVSYLCVRVGYICKLKENLNSLKSSLADLVAVKQGVKNKVAAGEHEGRQKLPIVARWLSQVETIETETDQLITAAEPAQGASSVRRRFSTCKLSEELVNKLNEVERLCKSGKEFIEVTEIPPPPVVVVRDCDQTVGLDTILKNIWESIRKDENRILGIYGMAGVGKTTLLTLINNKFVEFENDYDVVIWVESSKDTNIGKIQDAIGERLRLCDNNWLTYSITKKAGEISRILRNMKPRFVLLLDGLWKDVSLTAIGIPVSPVRERKYKVVFTTRSKDVCSNMEANEDIQVQCLSENEAWDLFKLKVRSDRLSNEIAGIAKKIASNCCGLPLAIDIIGKKMASETTVREWNRAHNMLESCPSELRGIERIYKVLKSSYDTLELKDAKCFQYCALFPNAYKIEQDELVEYWIGEGFIDTKKGREIAKDRGYEIINNLVKESLLLVDGSEANRKVYMHDMIRKMALLIVSKITDGERFVVETDAGLSEMPDVSDWTTVTKMSLINNKIKSIRDDPQFPDQTNLVTLFLQNNKLEDIVGKFFMVMSALVVLDLSRNLQITKLPEEISKLVSLRLLNLSGTRITHLPEWLRHMSQLIHLNLESTLNLRSLGLISELKKLQVLRFYNSAAALDSSLLKILEQLKGLELLSVTVNEDSVLEEFLGNERLAGMTQALYLEGLNVSFAAIGALSSLQKLEMVECEITESGTEYEGKRRENLYSPFTSPSQINHPWFKDLSVVVINSCIHLKDLTWLMYAKNLESLSVESSPKMREVISKEKAERIGDNPFQELQVLRLHYLDELRSIYGFECEVSFPKLKLNKVDIENCPNLHQRPVEENII